MMVIDRVCSLGIDCLTNMYVSYLGNFAARITLIWGIYWQCQNGKTNFSEGSKLGISGHNEQFFDIECTTKNYL